jgi:hypothetical protein
VYLLKALNRSERNPLLYLPLLFVYNCWLLRGELAYLIGLGGFFLYSGYLVRRLSSPESISRSVVILASCSLFFTHIGAYAAAGLASAAIVLTNPSKELWRRLAIPFYPSVALLISSFIGQKLEGGPAAGAVWRFWTLHQLAGSTAAAFAPFQGFLPWIGFAGYFSDLEAVVNIVSLAIILFACAATSIAVLRVRGDASVVPLASFSCMVAVVAAGYSYGQFFSPGERFLYPAAWLAFCWLGYSWSPNERVTRIATTALATLIAIQGWYFNVAAAKTSTHIGAELGHLRGAESREEFCRTYNELFTRSWEAGSRPLLAAFFPTNAPVAYVPYYIYIQKAEAAPIHPVGLISKEPNGDYTNACGVGAIAGGAQ